MSTSFDLPRRLCDRCGEPVLGVVPCCRRCAPAAPPPQHPDEAMELVPPSHRWARMDAPELAGRVTAPGLVPAALRSYVGAVNVTFTGEPGTGKTSLATALWHASVASSPSRAHYTTSLDLVRERRLSRLGEEPEAVTRARMARVLLLDDLGLEAPAWCEVLIEVIHERAREERPTIVTAAISEDAIVARYGGGIARRLLEAPAVVIRLPARGAR